MRAVIALLMVAVLAGGCLELETAFPRFPDDTQPSHEDNVCWSRSVACTYDGGRWAFNDNITLESHCRYSCYFTTTPKVETSTTTTTTIPKILLGSICINCYGEYPKGCDECWNNYAKGVYANCSVVDDDYDRSYLNFSVAGRIDVKPKYTLDISLFKDLFLNKSKVAGTPIVCDTPITQSNHPPEYLPRGGYCQQDSILAYVKTTVVCCWQEYCSDFTTYYSRWVCTCDNSLNRTADETQEIICSNTKSSYRRCDESGQ